MSRPKKIDRNKELIKLRKSNPEYYSYGKLGEIFGISKITVYQIYQRETGEKKMAR